MAHCGDATTKRSLIRYETRLTAVNWLERVPMLTRNRTFQINQTWANLVMAHWGVAPEAIAHLLPSALKLDTINGKAWISVVPFQMVNIHPVWLPRVFSVRTFLELNLRTYVRPVSGGESGIWFFSLATNHRLISLVARTLFQVPYYFAKASYKETTDGHLFRLKQTRSEGPSLEFDANYRPLSTTPCKSAVDLWLAERYCFYCVNQAEQLQCGKVDHEPWQMVPAMIDVHVNTIGTPWNLEIQREPDLVHFSKELVVRSATLETVAGC